jgi:copper chaperone CopZ
MEFHVEGMTCGGCARGVTRAIQAVDAHARVNKIIKRLKVVAFYFQ